MEAFIGAFSGPKRDGRLLRGIQHWSGALEVEATVPQFVEDTMQSFLDVGQGVEWRKLPVADFGVTTVAGKLQKITPFRYLKTYCTISLIVLAGSQLRRRLLGKVKSENVPCSRSFESVSLPAGDMLQE